MRGDFSRIRLSRDKGYTAVLEQQGRVALDADANEQRYLDGSLRRTETLDVIGQFGGPAGDEGFRIWIDKNDITIGAGRYYVGGLMVENPHEVTYEKQPFLVVPADATTALFAKLKDEEHKGQALQFYLQVWQRHVTALDDPCLCEPALGGADTTARLQTVWQVVTEFEPVRQPGACCAAMYAAVSEKPTESTGTLTVTPSGASTDCGCSPVPAAGYQGIENQLYRVEIHTPGDTANGPAGPTFKWSRENGSVVAAVKAISGAVVQVDSLGPDANLGFDVSQWVELTDDSYTLGPEPNKPGRLYQVQSIDKDDSSLTLTTTVTGIHAHNPRIRRWDQSGPSAGPGGIPLPVGTSAELENGIQVSFSAGVYKSGDYWTVPARAAKGTIEWPPCGSQGNAQPPQSVPVLRAPLACMQWAGNPIDGRISTSDCRQSFNPLTVQAIHVQEIGWRNDDIMSFEALRDSGLTLTVTLDQRVDGPHDGPVDGGNFIVTFESFEPFEQVEPDRTNSVSQRVIRSIGVLEPQVIVSGRQLKWQPLDKDAALTFITSVLTPSRLARVRVRLLGQTIFTTGMAGRIYLDGRAFGQRARRVDGTTPRIDLQFPSGDGSASSDLESWFYIAPG